MPSCKVAIAMFAIAATTCPSTCAGILLQSTRTTQTDYEGISPPDFWEGDTKVIDFNPDDPEFSGDPDFLILSANFGNNSRIPYADGPIRIYDASRLATASTEAKVLDSPRETGHAEYELGPSQLGLDYTNEPNAVFAEVLNKQDLQLARAEAFSSHESEFSHSTFEARGKMSSEAFLLASLRDAGSLAAGNAETSLRASYEVTEEREFVLDVMLGGTDGLDLGFRMTELSTETEVISETIHAGIEHRVEFCGTLFPGRYDIELTGATNAVRRTNGSDLLGGDGAYDIYFAAFDAGATGALHLSGNVGGGEPVSVPEPAAFVIMLAGAIELLLRRERKVRRRITHKRV